MILRFLLLAGCVAFTTARTHDYHPFVNFGQGAAGVKDVPNPAEHTANFWYNTSFESLNQRLHLPLRKGLAKNVILFLGDGMSMSTVTAARIYLGQLNNRSGEETELSFEQFPFTGLAKTYCVDSQVADSACAGTAFLSGVKGNYHTIGVTADVLYKDWQAMRNSSLYAPSILQWAQEAGKGTGIVTTCKVTDASPAAAYAHTASREWQTDLNIQAEAPDAMGVKDIASQLIENMPGKNIKVILGGGREVFLPKETQDEYGFNGTRGDKKDLINLWKTSKNDTNSTAEYVTSREQLLNVDFNKTEYLMGLFHHYHMDYHLHANNTFQPTLSDMTYAALSMMQKEKNGYFLFIEGGKIDQAHHINMAHLALDEAAEFHRAIELATLMTKEEDTLIVVTADHAHTMSLSGYAPRGGDVINTIHSTKDKLSYSTLSYANGPNKNRFNPNGTQHDIAGDDRANVNYTFPTIYNMTMETHDGQDVAVYARGPFAHLFVGTFEQTVIAHGMAYAAGIGPAVDAIPKVVSASGALWPQGVAAILLVALAVTGLRPW